MKIQRFAIALTLINLALLILLLAQKLSAGAQNVAPVLRGRALEIVDSEGRVRASITKGNFMKIVSREGREQIIMP